MVAVTKYAAGSSLFKGYYQVFVKVVSAYELYASQKLVTLDGKLSCHGFKMTAW